MANRSDLPERPLKLAFWSTSYFRGFGGAEKIVNDMLHSLKNTAGIQLYLITEKIKHAQVNNDYFPPLPDQVQIYQNTFTNPLMVQHNPVFFLFRLLKYFKASIQLAFFFRHHKIDIIHLHMVNIDVLLLILYKYLFRYRLVITFTGMEMVLAESGFLSRWKMKAALHHADRVSTVSRDICRQLKQKFAYQLARYIPNGIDVKDVRAIAGARVPGIEKGSYMFCGRLHPVKRITFLIDVFNHCINAGCRRKLYIIGDGGEMPQAQNRIAQYAIADQVILLGARDHETALRIMAQGKCLLLSSYSEGHPIVVLEAMALGIPAIAPAVGGLSEMITHGENGFLYPVDGKTQFQECIMALEVNPALGEKMGHHARTSVAQNFSHAHMMAQYMEIYKSLWPEKQSAC